MTEKDRNEIRTMLDDVMTGHANLVEGKFNVIHVELLAIKEQTTKTNGRVTSLEDDVDTLEKSEISRKAVIKFIGIAAGIASGIATIIVALVQLIIR